MQIWPQNYHLRALFCYKPTRNALFVWFYGNIGSWKAHMGRIMMTPAINSHFSTKTCCKTQLECKHGQRIIACGLCFTINGPEMHFLRDIAMMWPGVIEVPNGSYTRISPPWPCYAPWTSIFLLKCAWKTNIGLNLPFPGFTLLEND